MKLKVSIGILTILLLTAMVWTFPTVSAAEVTIGVAGPMGLIQGDGMKEGAELAKIDLGGKILGKDIKLIYADEFQGLSDGSYETGAAAMGQLLAGGAEFAIGGFRTESVHGMRETAMDVPIVYMVTGAATNELIDCAKAPQCAWGCVRHNYDRYKYVFRITPVNSTMLVKSVTGVYAFGIKGFIQQVLETLVPIYGFDSSSPFPTPHPQKQVKVAVITENLVWADGFDYLLTTPSQYPIYMGPIANVTYKARVSPTLEDYTEILTAVKTKECRLVIMIISAEKAGRAFSIQMQDLHVPAVAVGINVIEQMSEAWVETGGKVEYETFLHSTGTRTPITAVSETFWDKYLAKWGRAPIYTAYGAYQGLILLAEAIERAGTFDKDAVVAQLEAGTPPDGYYVGALGKFKFTKYHDVFSLSYGEDWPDGYVRSIMTQWQAGKHEVVTPKYSTKPTILPYWKRWQIKLTIYPYKLDLNYDGYVDMKDISLAARSFGSYPCHPKYDRGAAIIIDDPPPGPEGEMVTMRDIAAVARAFGTDYRGAFPLPYTWYTTTIPP